MAEADIRKESDIGAPEAMQPAANISEQGNNLVMRMELPNVEEKDLKVTIESEKVEVRTNKTEKSQGMFKRIDLPSRIVKEQGKFEFKNGMLTVTMPKQK